MRVVIDGKAEPWAHDLARQVNAALDLLSRPRQYTVAALPSPMTPGQTVYVTDESGGPVLAFSDGVAWRRTTDRGVVS